MADVVVHLDTLAIKNALSSRDGGVARSIFRRSQRVATRAKRNVHVDTGRLRGSITAELLIKNGLPVGRVGSNVHYARYVHDGTGLYGPKKHLIRPVNGRVLAFDVRGTTPSGRRSRKTTKVIVRYTRGSKPNPYLTDALREAGRP